MNQYTGWLAGCLSLYTGPEYVLTTEATDEMGEKSMRGVRYLAVAVVATIGILGTGVAHGATPPSISLSASVAPPAGQVTVSGSGFGANEAVDILWDGNFVGIKGTDGSGNFSYQLTVPSSTTAGEHLVGARGERDALYADSNLLVQYDWTSFRNDLQRRGVQAGESTLSPSNVAGMDVEWKYRTGGKVESSPSISGGVLYEGSDDGKVYALNMTTGAKLWTYATHVLVQDRTLRHQLSGCGERHCLRRLQRSKDLRPKRSDRC